MPINLLSSTHYASDFLSFGSCTSITPSCSLSPCRHVARVPTAQSPAPAITHQAPTSCVTRTRRDLNKPPNGGEKKATQDGSIALLAAFEPYQAPGRQAGTLQPHQRHRAPTGPPTKNPSSSGERRIPQATVHLTRSL